MNKPKYLLTTLSLFIMLPSITYAECSPEEIKHFKEIEDEYKVTYEFDNESKKYNVTYINPELDKYTFNIYDTETVEQEVTIDENGLIIKQFGVHAGEKKVEIMGATDTCNSKLKTIKIKLPEYNKYHDDPLCEGIEEFVLCKQTYEKEIDYDTFVSRVNTYKKTKLESEEKLNEEKNKKNSELLNFIKNNLLQIIIIFIFTITMIITIVITAKSIKKSGRLE